jgi:hypothetical protein
MGIPASSAANPPPAAPLHRGFFPGIGALGPIEKVFLKSLGFDRAALALMAACFSSLIPLLDLASGILANRWSREGVLMLASVAGTDATWSQRTSVI